ncbi:glycosyltransferase family 4 protein [bacterium]|nr:glycosyltransferase family 4 protein [bacterium]MBU1634366.1 glycosyltransferase family 4 protein [bacterium]MBU1900952.1 glycosyltransferase family 4 protein [Patescibacteria group bacterium]
MQKILLLNYEFPPLGGGAGNATYYLLKEFAGNHNIKIDLVTSSSDRYKEECFSENIRIYFLDIGKRENIHYQSYKDLLSYSWKAFWFARKLIIKAKKEGSPYQKCHAFFGIPCGYIAMKLGLPYIVSLRGSDVPFYNKRFKKLDKWVFKRMSKKIWNRAEAVVANSQGLKDLALKTAQNQSVDIIYNGVDTNEFAPRSTGQKTDKFTVLYVGRLIERKGVQYLLEAFNKLNKKKDAKLVLVGAGNLAKNLKNKYQKDDIQFLGALPHKDLAKVYQQADVFVLPSFNEGMSNTVLEALASGLAVIVTDTGGTKELVKNTDCIVQKKSAESIFRVLELFKKNPDMAAKIGRQNRETALQMNWQKAARQYMDFYKL